MTVESEYKTFIALNFLNSFLLIPPTVWHYIHGNASSAALGTWFFFSLLLVAINASIWFNGFDNKAPTFCDVSVKIEGACSFGTVISAFYVAQHLAAAVSPGVGIRNGTDRKQLIKEYLTYFGLPWLLVATQPLYQYGRFQIIQGLGCRRSAQNNFFFLYIQVLLPVFIILSAAGYMAYASVRVWINRINLQRISENAGMPTPRFVRIICVCWTYIALALVFFFYGSFATLLNRSIGWTSTLTPKPELMTQIFFKPNSGGPSFADWNQFFTTVPYTVFFGLSPDMLLAYRDYIYKLLKIKPAQKGHMTPVVAPITAFAVKETAISASDPPEEICLDPIPSESITRRHKY